MTGEHEHDVRTQKERFAQTGLTCAIVGVFGFGVLALPGVVLAILALLRRDDGTQGTATARAALVVGGIAVALWIAFALYLCLDLGASPSYDSNMFFDIN